MKKNTQKKLTLNKETLRDLSDSTLNPVAGGVSHGGGCGPSNWTDGCVLPSDNCTTNFNC